MPTSLIELIRRGEHLATATGASIHYPEGGHRRLAAVEEDHFWFTQRRELVLRLLTRFLARDQGRQPNECAPVGIDVGCGSGYTAAWLTERGIPTYGQDVYGGFRDLQRQGRGIGFIQGDITCVDPVPEFDFALLLDVIEHIPDDKGFVDHVGKFVKPGGILVITVPAFSWLWSSIDDASGHLRRYVKRDIRALEILPVSRLAIEFSSYFYAATLPLYIASRFALKFQSRGKRDAQRAELKPPTWANGMLNTLLRAEQALLLSVGMPVGSSLFLVVRKYVERDAVGTPSRSCSVKR
jgi:SAM-dependent methyltransferase